MVAVLNKPPTVAEYEGTKPPTAAEYDPIEPQRISVWEPTLKERIKNVISGMVQRSPFVQPGKRLGQLGLHHFFESISGLGLYIPDVITSKISESDTLASAIDKFTGFEPTPRDVRAGEAAKFVTSLHTVGRILGPAITAIPARPALQVILNSGVTFGGRKATEEIAKKISTGKPVDVEGIHFEGGIGVLFGAGTVGVSKFVSWIKNFRALSKIQIRPARAEVNAALKHYQKTGDRTRWDVVRIKYAGIKPEGVSKIRARQVPPEVREFGKYPLGKPIKPPPTVGKLAPTKPVAGRKVEIAPVAKGKALEDKFEWELTISEKIASEGFGFGKGKTEAQVRKNVGDEPMDALLRGYKKGIQKALSEGKPVPAEVLAEYPDLAPTEAIVAPEKPVAGRKAAEAIVGPVDTLSKWVRLNREIDGTLKEMQKVSGQARETLRDKLGSLQAERNALDMGHKIREMTPEEIAEDEKFHAIAQDILNAGPDKVNAVLDILERRIGLLTKVSEGILTQEEADILTAKFVTAAKARIPEPQRKQVQAREIAPVTQPEAVGKIADVEFIKDRWDSSKLGYRVELVMRGKWVTKKGQITKSGEKYAESKWDELSPAVQNVVRKFIAQDYKRQLPEAQPPTVAKPEAVEKPPTVAEYEAPIMATQVQKAQAHIIAKRKGFVSEKGKMRPGYRYLAKAMTGQTSIAKMTEQQATDFINALNKLPEPRIKGGRLIPPTIPRITKLVPKGFAQRQFKRPTPVSLITSNAYYAEKLGVKSLVEPLERAKMRFDLEHHSASNEIDKMGQKIDVLGKTTAKEKITAKVRNIPTRARVEMGDLLDKYEEAPADLSPKKKEIFDWFRNLTRTILKRQNEARAKLDLPLIKERKAYMRHVATDISREMLAGKYPFPEGVGFWSGLNVGKKIFNPMEFQRKLEDDVFGLFTKDPVYASKAMMYNALKEIHLNQPLKFFNEQLSALGKDLPEYKNLSPKERAELDKTSVMPADTRRWLIDYVRTVIKGQQTNTDMLVNNIVNESGLRGLLNTALRPFGRTLSQRPVTKFFQGAGRVQMAGVMGPRPRLLIRNKFQLTQNLALYGTKANIRAFLPPNKELKELLDKSLFLKSYTGLEELPADLAKKVEKLWHTAYQWTASSNARQAMEVAYWDTKELIDNPKYKKYGWKPEHLLKEMEFGASATQYQYNAIGMPGIFRHKSLIPATRLTSWWMNYFAKFHREALHRAFTGRPSWSGPDGPTLPWSRRLGWLRYAVFGGLILNTMGYTRSFMFGAAPTGWPPALQAVSALYRYTIADDDAKRKAAKVRFFNAVKTFIPGYIAYKDFNAIWTGRKDLESLFFYKKREKTKGD